MSPPPLTSLLSRPFAVSTLGDGAVTFVLKATKDECEALAAHHDVIRVDSFEATLVLWPEGKEGVVVKGEIRAHLERRCVLTGESFSQEHVSEFEHAFVPLARLKALEEGYASLSYEDRLHADLPDAMIEDRIDLGAVVEEHFILNLDPYPKKPGVTFHPPSEAGISSPFSILSLLKSRS